MKKLTILCLSLMISATSFAQKTEWVKTLTEQSSEISEDRVVIDGSGNHYISLTFKKAIQFGANVILKAKSQTGESDAVIAKLDEEGKRIIWTKQITSNGNVKIKNITLDPSGNPIVVGFFEQETDFGGTKLTPKGNAGFFIAKYNSSGDLQWVKSGGTYTTIYPNSADAITVTLDMEGNILVAATAVGMYDGWVDDPSLENEYRYRGKIYYEGKDYTEIYTGAGTILLKLTPSGDLTWSKMSKLGLTVMDMKTDNSGNVYYTGVFVNVAFFLGQELQSNGLMDIFVAKASPAGELIWFKQFGGGKPYKIGDGQGDIEQGTHLAIDEKGNVYVGGIHFDKANFDGTIQPSDAAYKGQELGTFFVTKLNTDGKLQWIHSAESKSGGRIGGLTCDKAGNTYTSGILLFKKGSFAGDNAKGCFITKLDTDGNLIWSNDADDRKGSVKVVIFAPGSLALSKDEGYLLQTASASEKEVSETMTTITTTTSIILAISKVKTN
jgi:hypothetical protein